VSGTSETHLFRRISSNPVAAEILKPKQVGFAGDYSGKPNSSSADPNSNEAKVHEISKDFLRSSSKKSFGLRFRTFILGKGAEAETA
jgi:hypothetical protein